ncbi:unnamed protein product [Linum trigynum]|uniref:Retrotransposon gag domain-containing protein n=1 Tax=Linum trigynum TaxID=586398 RepID=A0AAV2FUG3_9ROSI
MLSKPSWRTSRELKRSKQRGWGRWKQKLEANPNPDPRPQQGERERENRAPPTLVHELQRHMRRHRRLGMPRAEKRGRQQQHEEVEVEEFDEGFEDNDDLKNLSVTIPPFCGTTNLDAYLDWERKMKLEFDCRNYSEKKKVTLVSLEFLDYALIWWDQLCSRRRRNRQRPIETWDEMKGIMRDRFVPNSHLRDMCQNLLLLRQGTKSVEDYHKEMEALMIRADVSEDREATIACFLYGLNREIKNVVKIQLFLELEDLVDMASKVERHLRNRRFQPSTNSTRSK